MPLLWGCLSPPAALGGRSLVVGARATEGPLSGGVSPQRRGDLGEQQSGRRPRKEEVWQDEAAAVFREPPAGLLGDVEQEDDGHPPEGPLGPGPGERAGSCSRPSALRSQCALVTGLWELPECSSLCALPSPSTLKTTVTTACLPPQSLLDYEVDSDEEWEEDEPGESLSHSEGVSAAGLLTASGPGSLTHGIRVYGCSGKTLLGGSNLPGGGRAPLLAASPRGPPLPLLYVWAVLICVLPDPHPRWSTMGEGAG